MLRPALLTLAWAALSACSVPDLQRSSPREHYLAGLENGGLLQTRLVDEWQTAARSALNAPARLALPVSETIWVEQATPRALAYRVSLLEDQFLHVMVQSLPYDALNAANGEVPPSLINPLDQSTAGSQGKVFHEVYSDPQAEPHAWLKPHDEGSESEGNEIDHSEADESQIDRAFWQVDADGEYTLLIQPELLAAGRFNITISVRSALAFPVFERDNTAVRSFFGAPRDGGRRAHHGVDIFAPRGTAVLAVADGTVARTGDTPLGGLHVWQRSASQGHRYYYAHLDSISVAAGDRLKAGDVIGTVGNTGNARLTPPHLHFGVYATFSGPVDPLPMISLRSNSRPELTDNSPQPAPILEVDAARLNVRAGPSTADPMLEQLIAGQRVAIVARAGAWYRVRTLEGSTGYVSGEFLRAPVSARPETDSG
ncbi:peptidoglycan DD-metalloendopeptidase family protein [Allohahella marinimesophila]|uniref:SH3b domain-containing protein n=1 Tax=Allohahella marinimesophila TaxID=1054972 RepID=A0ABP7NJ84_9GAMM